MHVKSCIAFLNFALGPDLAFCLNAFLHGDVVADNGNGANELEFWLILFERVFNGYIVSCFVYTVMNGLYEDRSQSVLPR